MPLAKAQPCLSRKQNRASRGRKKTENAFFSVSERHDRASRESKTVPLAEGKKIENAFFFFVFERHGRVSRESKTVPLVEEKKPRFFAIFFLPKAKEDRWKTKTSKKPV